MQSKYLVPVLSFVTKTLEKRCTAFGGALFYCEVFQWFCVLGLESTIFLFKGAVTMKTILLLNHLD